MTSDQHRLRDLPAVEREIRRLQLSNFTFRDEGSKGLREKRLLLVGTGKQAARLARQFESTRRQLTIVGALDSHLAVDFAREFPHIRLLGEFSTISATILDHCIDEVHVAMPWKGASEQLVRMQTACREIGVLMLLHNVSATEGLATEPNRPLEVPGAGSSVTCLNGHPATLSYCKLAKRAFDLISASLLVVVLVPLFLLIALLIKLTSPGPVFFRQKRIGQGRRIFGMLKFRTMVQNAEELRHEVAGMNNARGISFKVFRDPRVTAIGFLLRRTSLDELPQLVNVILGDMSLVGPRPIPLWVGTQLDSVAYFRRFCVLPGITGLWQVEGREQDFDHMAKQDLRYVDNWSLALDLKILFMTLPAVIRAEGAH